MSRGLALESAHGLVNQDAGVGQGVAFFLGARGQKHGGHAGRLANAYGGDFRLDISHGVVDGHACGDAAAGGVDVEIDVLFRVVGLQKKELGDDGVGHDVVDLRAQGR